MPRKQKKQCARPGENRDLHLGKENETTLPPPFCSSQSLDGLDAQLPGRGHWLLSVPETPPIDTPGNNMSPLVQACLHIKLTITDNNNPI